MPHIKNTIIIDRQFDVLHYAMQRKLQSRGQWNHINNDPEWDKLDVWKEAIKKRLELLRYGRTRNK